MNIQEMHNAFRTIGQQMGMQLIRGILPESIDVFINNVIIEKTQTELLAGVRTVLQDTVSTQGSTMSPINTFRNLYRTSRYEIEPLNDEKGLVDYYNEANGYHIINIPTVNASDIILDNTEFFINPMMYLGFSVEYADTLRGNAIACRLIGADVLETTLRDYCNGASKDSPIAVLNAMPVIVDDSKGKSESTSAISNEQVEIYTGTKDCAIKHINIKYIKTPNVVKFDLDLNKCVNCDLPAYTHFDIVERAVLKYKASIGASIESNPQQRRQTS